MEWKKEQIYTDVGVVEKKNCKFDVDQTCTNGYECNTNIINYTVILSLIDQYV